MEDAYELLARAKLPNESFTETIRRVVKPSNSLMKYWGAWNPEFGDEVKARINERRELNKERAEWRRKMFA